VVSAFPLLPMTWAPSLATMPVAVATPGTARTCSRTVAGMGVATCSPSNSGMSIFGLALTPTSVVAYTLLNRLSKDRLRVSVRTKAPATNMTPRTTASPEKTSRRVRASRLFRVARSITGLPRW